MAGYVKKGPSTRDRRLSKTDRQRKQTREPIHLRVGDILEIPPSLRMADGRYVGDLNYQLENRGLKPLPGLPGVFRVEITRNGLRKAIGCDGSSFAITNFHNKTIIWAQTIGNDCFTKIF